MNEYQEPKYEIKDGKLVNRASGEVIPPDEPIMIFRGRDRRAFNAIHYYAQTCADPEHRNVAMQRAMDFAFFAMNNPERMKEPDTAKVSARIWSEPVRLPRQPERQ